METIEDIIAEMRSAPLSWCYPEGIPQAQHDNDMLIDFANRIEKAVTNCNQHKMREALEDSQHLLENFAWGDNGAQVREQMRDNKTALSAQPRNCDVYRTSWDVVTHWDGGLDSTQSLVLMLDWLLAEAKGETNENTL